MTTDPTAIFLLDDGLCQSLGAGRHNFLGKVKSVLERSGFGVEIRRDSVVERAYAKSSGAWTILHMAPVLNGRSLTVRRVYHYPFWAIEQTDERWNWRVAKSAFDSGAVPRRRADHFHGFWGKRLYGAALEQATREGFLYVPLQGRLRQHRSFQACSPVAMLRAVCEGTDKPVRASLHPREIYDSADRREIAELVRRFPNLEITDTPMVTLLAGCDAVVTQNSSVAFNGYFFGKPAVLFAQSDFHHIALRGEVATIGETLAQTEAHRPDYAGYVHWFWQRMSVNAGRDTAETRIAEALGRAGWPVAATE